MICPNRLCEKEISLKFDNCPFCHTPLIKYQRTAEDIINEHKYKEEQIKEQKEEILRSAVRKSYNITGDVSEEQYEQLIKIWQPLKIKYQTFNNINYNSALYML